ncbi:MAG: hypothetical protein ILO42_07530 [Clostridia bacterium]|nr:hypothetical protein [Clostridia bacterium]
MAKTRQDFDLKTAAGAIDAYKNATAGLQSEYTDPYAAEKASALGAVKNAPAFEYDPGKDLTYQIYQRQYAANAKQARDGTLARATALTGGYDNSYAQRAGQQAYDEQMSRLEAIIPQLRAQARSEYDADRAERYNYLNTILNLGESDFNRWLSQQNLSRQDAAELLALYQNNRALEYQKERDAVSDAQWQKTYDLNYYTAHKSGGSGGTTTTGDAPTAIADYYKYFGYDKPRDFVNDYRAAKDAGSKALIEFLNGGADYGLTDEQIMDLYYRIMGDPEFAAPIPGRQRDSGMNRVMEK